jgi:hypothetical protein
LCTALFVHDFWFFLCTLRTVEVISIMKYSCFRLPQYDRKNHTTVMLRDFGFLFYGDFVVYLIWRRLEPAKFLPSRNYHTNQKFNVKRYLTRLRLCLSLWRDFLEAFFLLVYRIHTEYPLSVQYSPRIRQRTYYPLLFCVPWSRRGARKAVTAVDTTSVGRRWGGVHSPVLQAVMRERRWRVRVAGCCLGNACARVITNQVTLSCPSL